MLIALYVSHFSYLKELVKNVLIRHMRLHFSSSQAAVLNMKEVESDSNQSYLVSDPESESAHIIIWCNGGENLQSFPVGLKQEWRRIKMTRKSNQEVSIADIEDHDLVEEFRVLVILIPRSWRKEANVALQRLQVIMWRNVTSRQPYKRPATWSEKLYYSLFLPTKALNAYQLVDNRPAGELSLLYVGRLIFHWQRHFIQKLAVEERY